MTAHKTTYYIFVNYKYTSPFNLTHLYTIDHARITGYRRNYDPFKQYLCLLPYGDTSWPRIVPQDFHFDDFLLPCNIPIQIIKPLTLTKHVVSSPFDDKNKPYYTALAKQSYSYSKILFISAKYISYMVQTEPPIEHTSPIRSTHPKHSSVLNNRTIRDTTHLLDY